MIATFIAFGIGGWSNVMHCIPNLDKEASTALKTNVMAMRMREAGQELFASSYRTDMMFLWDLSIAQWDNKKY